MPALLLIIAVAGPFELATVRADPCVETMSIGIDSSFYNSLANIQLGFAIGQTFIAPTARIEAITAYRIPPETYNIAVWHMFVMALDSTGTPDVHEIIRDGPTVVVPYGDGVHLTPFRFQFDPPVDLPAVGAYAFAVQGDSCRGWFDLATNQASGQAYPDGILWEFGRQATFCDFRPRSNPEALPESDLIFEIEFCSPETPVRRTSWGSIKAVYR